MLEDRGIVSMKGKIDQLTYWLRGEEVSAAATRARSRAEKSTPVPLPLPEKRGPRSSLKNRTWKNQITGLHRSENSYFIILNHRRRMFLKKYK